MPFSGAQLLQTPESPLRRIVRDYADFARFGGVSRARITQIMNLLNLPPWKQEEILFLACGSGRTAVTEREMRRVGELAWEQR